MMESSESELDAEPDLDADPALTPEESGEPAKPLTNKRVWFVGKLGGVTRRQAQNLVRQQGGVPVDAYDDQVELIVIGADELPLGEEGGIPDVARDAAAEGRLEIISETQLWQRLGLVEGEQSVRRLYTPAMLAELLKVPIATVRSWHRRGLIVPAREVHRLPYFDFQEIATARHLAELVAAGASPASIEKKLAALARYVPEVERPLAQLSVIIEGRQLLLRQGEGLIEPGGQRRIDFEALEAAHDQPFATNDDAAQAVVPFVAKGSVSGDLAATSTSAGTSADADATPERLVELLAEAEEGGDIETAIDLCRAALAAAGPRPELVFQLAELLYRNGELTAARERYYMAIELDEDFVEARANLGCLLAELGQVELATAAFEGALRYHPDYPDAHYHLARALDDLGQSPRAEEHWRAFLQLAPDSPWADEASGRLSEIKGE